MSTRHTQKRKLKTQQSSQASKRRKVIPATKKSENAWQRATIPIPDVEEDALLSEEDIEFFQENKGSGLFLQNLDNVGIARSKKETERLHQLSRAAYKRAEREDDLPSVHSHEEDSQEWDSNAELSDMSVLSSGPSDETSLDDSDNEQPYEKQPRARKTSPTSNTDNKSIQKLPIKLPNGKIQQTGQREGIIGSDHSDTSSESDSQPRKRVRPPKRDINGPRFGRAAVADVISIQSRKDRIEAAKEQIASICQDILSEPEHGLGMLRRLISFASRTVDSQQDSGPIKVANDTIIQRLAILSLVAVFKDMAPGYRIRKLTDKEKSEKVSQMVGQTREWEQGLVSAYQSYLQLLEKEIKDKTELAEVSLQSMCILLKDLTHFNFRTNIMSTVIARLSRRSWDNTSQMCSETLESVLKQDITGVPSLEVVRLLNRMVKERQFNVHANVLDCLLHLRLKNELRDVRASAVHAEKDGSSPKKLSESKAKIKRAKGKGKTEQPHLSKKAKKALKETKEIRAELEEAEAEVDREERATQHTETLKLLFVLYFSILKAPKTSPLLVPALQGISKFAHLVNIDFFKDLLAVIKDIVHRENEETEQTGDDFVSKDQHWYLQILCIVTAFELLTGQGEALNLDLSQFTLQAYKIIPDLGLYIQAVESVDAEKSKKAGSRSTVDLLFRALSLILMPRFGKPPSYLLAAFSKRLVTFSLQTPPETTIKTLEFVKNLLGRDTKLDILLSTEDRVANGIYRDDVDDPQLCNPFGAVLWELAVLGRHWDAGVRKAANSLSSWKQA